MQSKKVFRTTPLIFGFCLVALLVAGMAKPLPPAAHAPSGDPVEPGAGSWRTWVLSTGSQLRPAAPPSIQQTQAEILELKDLAKQRDKAAIDRIKYWNTGAPAYRWNEMLVKEAVQRSQNSMVASRALAHMNAAIYDATVAAWDAKYTYDRPRPSEFNQSLKTVLENPSSPSYPAEHAVTAGAASEVLAYLYPDRAGYFRELAEEAGEAFLIAGIQYPSDVETGLDLGRQVAMLVIQRAQNDGSTAQWDGSMPTGPGYWTGQNPALPMMGTWQTWVLEDGSEFRPDAPYAYDSPEMAAELAELKNFQRTPATNSHAQFWEWGAGGTRNFWFWNEILSKKLLEYQMNDNAPQAARAYALANITYYDAAVACWDAKYTYWAIRPFQLDPTFQTLFATPNHPSYPSAHSCLSGSFAEILAYLFPYHADDFRVQALAAGEARIWAGLHFRHDIVVGLELGRQVAEKMIEEVAENDGSQ